MTPPRFDCDLPHDGYAWWYLDVLDPTSGAGLTIIAMLGNVFSPGYARARKRGPADPLDFCAINIALYGPTRRWVMTEHADVARSEDALRIGGTTVRYDGADLVVEFDERCAPFGRRLQGTARITPRVAGDLCHRLDPDGRHRWWPIAPVAHATVELTTPQLRFEGHGYHDINQGDRPLEADFRSWNWCRGTDGLVLYDVIRRDGTPDQFARRFLEADEPVPTEVVDLPKGGWGVARSTRTAAPIDRVVTLEDTPFYTRSWLERGEAHVMHESLDLDRFDRAWVRFLLPFRMKGGFRW